MRGPEPRAAALVAGTKITEMYDSGRRSRRTTEADDAAGGEGAVAGAAAGRGKGSGEPQILPALEEGIEVGAEAEGAAADDMEMAAVEDGEQPPSAAASDADEDFSDMDMEGFDGGETEAASPAAAATLLGAHGPPAGLQQAGGLGAPVAVQHAAVAALVPPAVYNSPPLPAQAAYLGLVPVPQPALYHNGGRGVGEGAGRGRHPRAGGRCGASGVGVPPPGGGVSTSGRGAQLAAEFTWRAKQTQPAKGTKRRQG